MQRSLTMLCLLGSLAACSGWHLQGALDLPPDLRSVRVTGGEELTRDALLVDLTQAGLTLSAAGDPDLLLVIHDDVAGERMVSVTASGRPNEFEVFRVLEFSAARAGQLLLDHRRIELTADYSYSSIDVLARQLEAQELADSLDVRVRQQLLREVRQAVAQ